MQIVTSWMEQGLEQGLQQGKKEGELAVILRLLSRRVGTVPSPLQERIQCLSTAQLEALSEALLDLTNLAALTAWLDEQEQAST